MIEVGRDDVEIARRATGDVASGGTLEDEGIVRVTTNGVHSVCIRRLQPRRVV